ncbi:MAG: hypothetical protein ACE5IH_05715 [Thermodesulfobacteriota bacterium]
MVSTYYLIVTPDPIKRQRIKDCIEINPSRGLSESFGQIIIPHSKKPLYLKTFLYGCKNDLSISYDHVLAYFRDQNEEYPLIGISNKQVVVNFDFFEWEKRLLHEDYANMRRPLYTRFPFPYYSIPVSLRNIGLRMLSLLGGTRGKEHFEFPAFPIEQALDRVRSLIWESAAGIAGVELNLSPYPDSGKGCVVLTHDIETSEGLRNIELIRRVERHFAYPSSWSVISKRYKTEDQLLKLLIDEGCEIISHGCFHDGVKPYLSEAEILKRLEHLFLFKPWLKGLVNGYRSGQLLVSNALFRCLSKRFKYDLSIPDTERVGPYGPRGCCSIYPFYHREGILEIPLTVPQDYYHLHIYRYTAEEILRLWKEKIDYIEANNGIAVLLLHPETYLSGNEKMLDIYNRLLEIIAGKDLWVATPAMVYNYLENL